MAQFPTKITFAVNDNGNLSRYVNLADPERDIEHMQKPDEYVVPAVISVHYDYPFHSPATFKHTSHDNRGFTRAQLARTIVEQYRKMYEDEHAAVSDPGHIPDMFNRQTSSGPYGIWGHDLSDLVLHTIRKKGNIYELGVDS